MVQNLHGDWHSIERSVMSEEDVAVLSLIPIAVDECNGKAGSSMQFQDAITDLV